MRPIIAEMITEFHDFMTKEAKRFPCHDFASTKKHNLFNGVFGQPLMYLRYLAIIDRRQKQANTELKEALEKRLDTNDGGDDNLVDEDMELLGLDMATRAIHCRGELELKSLYQFAKLFLEKLASALQFYFGIQHLKALSHGKLMEKVKKTSLLCGMPVTAQFKQAAEDIWPITSFRDTQIVHENDPRTAHGTLLCSDDGLLMMFGLSYPEPGDKQLPDSLPANQVFDRLREYMKQVFAFIVTNQSNCALV